MKNIFFSSKLKFKYNVFLYLIILFLGISPNIQAEQNKAQQKNEDVDCSTVVSNLQSKNNNLSASLVNLDSLLGAQTAVDVPLTVLFQIELNNENAIQNRITELSKLTTQSNILQLSEFVLFQKCAIQNKQIDLLEDTLKKQIQLNTKRLTFLNLNKSERDSLIAAFESARQQNIDKKQIEQKLSESKELLERAQTNLIKSEKDISTGKNITDEKLMSAQSLLEKFMVDTETEHIQFIDNIKNE